MYLSSFVKNTFLKIAFREPKMTNVKIKKKMLILNNLSKLNLSHHVSTHDYFFLF